MEGEDFYTDLEEKWGYEENPEMYIGFLSAAVPEALSTASNYVDTGIQVWQTMTEYGLDKGSHLGFSFFGALAVWKASETIPDGVVQLTDDRDDWPSRKLNTVGRKAMDPSVRYKAGLMIGAVAAGGTAKEATDAYISYLDMTANMAGAGIATLKMYGDGDILEGAEMMVEDAKELLEPQPETTPDGGRIEPTEELMENMEALGKA